MKSVTYDGHGAIELVQTEAVDPGPREVQISVAYTGLCGTDLHVLRGHMDQRVPAGRSIGHEASGVVHAVGNSVTAWRPGDHVTVMPLDWDGTCPACRAGNEHVCQNLSFIGLDAPGSLQDLWTVPESCVVALPAALSLRHAALAEPVAVAVHDVRRGRVRASDSVVVIGGGPIGLLIAVVARHEGAEVLLIETAEARRTLAGELGFTTVDPAAEDVIDVVEQWTDGAGADVVFEVSGAEAAVGTATSVAKVRGTIVVVAIHPTPPPVDLQRVFWRELSIVGARVYERRDVERAVELLANGVVPADALITAEYPLVEAADAFAHLDRGGAMKILVTAEGADA